MKTQDPDRLLAKIAARDVDKATVDAFIDRVAKFNAATMGYLLFRLEHVPDLVRDLVAVDRFLRDHGGVCPHLGKPRRVARRSRRPIRK
ncbi:MAG: hypothetical protein AAB074_17975 [Planctomycetota bacterium]